MAGLDIAAGYRPPVPVNKGQRSPFPYGKKRSSVLDIRSALMPHDVSDLYDSVHESGNSRMLDALDTMPKANLKDAKSVVQGAMGGMVPNVSYGAESSRYSPSDETVHIDNKTHQRFPVAVSVHEGAHAFQSGRSDVDEKLNDRRAFGLHDKVAHELGPSLLGTAAEAEARRRGGTPVPDVSYQFPSGYSPKLDWVRQQADRFGLFNGENNVDDLLAKNPQWLNTIAQQGSQTGNMQPPTGEGLDALLGRDDPTVDVNPAPSAITQRRTPGGSGQLPSIDASGTVNTSQQQRAVGNTSPVGSQSSQPLRRSDSRPQINTPNTATAIPQNEDSDMASGLDIAAGYRPSVPVNKKRRTADYVGDTTGLAERFVGSGMNPGDFDEETGKVTTHAEADQYGREKDIYDAFYGHAGGEYVPGALQKAREGAARGGIIPGSSSNVRPSQPPMAPVAPRAGGTPPESTFNRGNGNWSSDYLAKKFADTDVESSMYRDAALHEPEETAAFRDRRSARDRAAGLNVGRRPGGEVSHPMMPGAAGMGTGPSNTNYGGLGEGAKGMIERENIRNEDPRTAERTQGLLDLAVRRNAVGNASGDAWEASGIWPFHRETPMSSISQPQNDAAVRIQALKDVGGLKGAADAGLLDRFVSGSSLSRSPNDTPERTAQLDNIAAIRQREKERKAGKLGDVNDPNSIAGRLQARGLAKGEARQQRMLDRAAGPSFDDRLAMMAAQRDPLGTLALSNQRYGDNAGVMKSRLENQPKQQISPEVQRTDAMTSAYYSPGPNGEPSPSERGVTRAEFGLPEIGGSGRSNSQSSTPPPTASSITSGIDRTMGEGFTQQLTDALASTSPNMFGGYLKPSAPLTELKPILDKLESAGLSNDPNVIEIIKRNIPPEYLKHLKNMAEMPDSPGFFDDRTSFLQSLTGQDKEIAPQAKRLLKLLGM